MDSSTRRKVEESALKYMNKKDYRKAIKEYETLLVATPDDPKYLKPIAECYKFLNENKNAIVYYDKLAKEYQNKGLFKQAVAIYNVIVETGEESETVYDDMAKCYLSLNMSVDATKVYKKLLEKYMIKGFFSSAIAVSQKILAIIPEDTIAIVNYAEAELASGSQEIAIEQFKKAAELYKKQNNLNMYIKILGRIDHVTNHSDPKILNELAMLYLTQKSYGPNLLEILLKSYRISKERNDNEALIETTMLLVTFFKETNQRKQMLSIMYELAKIYETTNNNKKALETYNKILQIAPGSQDVKKRAMEIQQKVNEEDGIVEEEPDYIVPQKKMVQETVISKPAIEQKSEQQGDKNAVKNSLREIDTYIKFKLFDKAEGIAKNLYVKFPEDTGIAKRLKEIYVKTGNLTSAIEILFSMFENTFKINQDEARTYLEEILYFDPDNVKAQKTLNKFFSASESMKSLKPKYQDEDATRISKSDIIKKDELESIKFEEDDFAANQRKDYNKQVEQIKFYIKQSMFDEAKKDLDLLLKNDSNNPELLKLLSNLENAVKPIIIEEKQNPKSGNSREFKEDINETFEKFKEGVEQSISKDDVKTRYDLAIAYKEMGMIDDAISEFKLVYKYTENKIDCLVMIGVCYIDKGDFDIAIKYFKKSMEFPSNDVNQKLAIYYEIANAHELQGNLKHAFEIFKKIVQKDRDFRDAYDRVKKIVEKIKNSKDYDDNQISYV